MADATAKGSALVLSDFGGEMPGVGENEWTANGATTAGAAVPFSLVVNEAIAARVPTTGWLTTANNEVLHYSAYVAGTKTFTIDLRAQQDTTPAAIDSGSAIGQWLTKRAVNQIFAELVAQAAGTQPNLVLNSDFGRRTVFGLAMPEVFADTSGYSLDVDAGADPTVASNILTFNAVGHVLAWPKSGFATFWRDGRASATFKATSTTGVYELRFHYVDSNNYVRIYMDGAGNVLLGKNVAGTPTTVDTKAQALTLNRWYWFELEAQGTTWIGKLYDTGGTASGVTKASSTLLQTVTGTIADAAIQLGGAAIRTDQSAGQWGGIATGNGGVYVETWLPESWTITHTGTLGGQAIGYDEAADSGPINKQWTPVVYIPAVSRTMTVQFSGPDGGMQASTAYDFSYYLKNTSLGGSGVMIRGNVLEQNSAQTTQATNSQDDVAETAYTRKTATFTTNAATRRFAFQFLINQGGARTGTVRFSLPQVEQGSAATAWRNAPADDGGVRFKKAITASKTFTTQAEADPRDLALNAFLPFDAAVDIEISGYWLNSGAGNKHTVYLFVDGTVQAQATDTLQTASGEQILTYKTTVLLAAGKHRISVQVSANAGTGTMSGGSPQDITALHVTAYRGK